MTDKNWLMTEVARILKIHGHEDADIPDLLKRVEMRDVPESRWLEIRVAKPGDTMTPWREEPPGGIDPQTVVFRIEQTLKTAVAHTASWLFKNLAGDLLGRKITGDVHEVPFQIGKIKGVIRPHTQKTVELVVYPGERLFWALIHVIRRASK